MRDFEKQNLRLSKLPLLGKVVYTVFLFFTVVGVVATVALYHDMVGISGERIGAYYHGEHVAIDSSHKDDANVGPSLDMPTDVVTQTEEAMPTRKLLEVTHFHLFSMPVYLLILSHLFMMTGFSVRSRMFWIAAASVATLCHLIAPWLTRSGFGFAMPFYAVSGGLLAVSYLWMSMGTLWGLWR